MARLASTQTYDIMGLSLEETQLIKYGVGLITDDACPEHKEEALATLRATLGITSPAVTTTAATIADLPATDDVVLPPTPYVAPPGGVRPTGRTEPLPGPSDGMPSFPKIS